MPTAALILAAGGSRRLGRPKQLEPWGDSTLLGRVVSVAREMPVDEIWVVVGAESEKILAETDLGDAGVIENPEWEEGIASSLRVGLDALTRLSRVERVVIMMGDQPDVSPEVVERLLEEHKRAKRPVSIPKYRYTLGNPVVVDRSLWSRVMSLEGDEGAMRLWRAHPEWVNEVWFPEQPPRDVDTEADVVELRPRHPAG
ncbi:MAG: nucleotidyltransferase family protein [Acidimicrobiales bacterium]|jgi:molybdenum cofactor cytidylyltransferase|nr:nucleotidyltransferase family protein [Acidimicrobiales bacterium]HLV90006.1 nucleotidyltransferase family protein [Acidimicrobiia bacterium]